MSYVVNYIFLKTFYKYFSLTKKSKQEQLFFLFSVGSGSTKHWSLQRKPSLSWMERMQRNIINFYAWHMPTKAVKYLCNYSIHDLLRRLRIFLGQCENRPATKLSHYFPQLYCSIAYYNWFLAFFKSSYLLTLNYISF